MYPVCCVLFYVIYIDAVIDWYFFTSYIAGIFSTDSDKVQAC